MTTYPNLNGDSAVRSYEIADTSILIEFQNGRRYLYDYSRPGPSKVEKMKELALAGRGLGTFISQRVKKQYARKVG